MCCNFDIKDYSGNIIQKLVHPLSGPPEFVQMYEKFAKRILWIDGNIVPGAFQMNTAWYYTEPERSPVFPEHTHAEDEMIGFFGSDPYDPYNLNAEIEVSIHGEKYILTKSTLMFIPGNVAHMPMKILQIRKPVFHFSIIMGGLYNDGAYK